MDRYNNQEVYTQSMCSREGIRRIKKYMPKGTIFSLELVSLIVSYGGEQQTNKQGVWSSPVLHQRNIKKAKPVFKKIFFLSKFKVCVSSYQIDREVNRHKAYCCLLTLHFFSIKVIKPKAWWGCNLWWGWNGDDDDNVEKLMKTTCFPFMRYTYCVCTQYKKVRLDSMQEKKHKNIRWEYKKTV